MFGRLGHAVPRDASANAVTVGSKIERIVTHPSPHSVQILRSGSKAGRRHEPSSQCRATGAPHARLQPAAHTALMSPMTDDRMIGDTTAAVFQMPCVTGGDDDR
ncbi:hypothetical protein SFHH103_psfHH103d_547 (plasmid) [Sinorhizobium fredii HH103]|nr:hypothetical protein SFHH103_psfHH103d_547 [Sinorhizobium fredii HH103]